MKKYKLLIFALLILITVQSCIAYINASGGSVSNVGNDAVHTFTSSGNFVVTGCGNISVLVVAGGGSATGGGGGAGGGGVLYNQSYPVCGGTYPVTVGLGGTANNNGQNSVFGNLTAIGGGSGANFVRNGGSGGGCGGGQLNPGTGTAGQGYSGGTCTASHYSGGGGAGETGKIANSTGGFGGNGKNYTISGNNTYYGGGGGGYPHGTGGLGGGGGSRNILPNDGTPNTGGGGGDEGDGGSGIVIIRYETTPPVLEPSINWAEPSEATNTMILITQNRPVILTANASNIENLTTYMCFEHVRPGGGNGTACKAANLTSVTHNTTIPVTDQYNYTVKLYNGTYPTGVLLASTSVKTIYIYRAYGGNVSAPGNWSKSARINMTAAVYTPAELPASMLQLQNYTLRLYNDTQLIKVIYNGTYTPNVTYNYYPDNLTPGVYTLAYYSTYNDTFNNVLREYIRSQYVEIMSDASLNITLKNALNSSVLTNATINVTDLTSSTTTTYTTTNGNIEAYILKGRNYTINIDAVGYAITQANYTANLSTSQFLNVSVYTENSVLVNIFDEANGLRITGTNISIVFTGTVEETRSTTSGTLYIDSLLDGAYTVKLSGGNYTLKTYSITVNNRSTQVLNAYLNSNIMTTIFQVLDQDTGENVYDASFLMERLINTTYVVVDSKSTDITGRVQVSYLPNVKYRFTIAKTGYVSQVFYLDPIIFSTYTVRLDSIGGGSTGQDFNDVNIIYYPRTFWNGRLNNFTWSASSPAGVLVNYTLNITYPGGSQARSGVNANGQTFNLNFTLANVSFYGKVNVTYTYTSTVGGTKQFSASYDILGANGSSNSSIVQIKQRDYGLGWFEKVFITTLVAIVIAGFVYSMAGLGGAMFTALIVYGVAAFLGFMPWWSVLITILVGLAIITADAKSGGA